MADESESALLTEDDIRQLPRWARVAFAARCARRVLPLVGYFWKDISEDHLRVLGEALSGGEQAAACAAAPPYSWSEEIAVRTVLSAAQATADTQTVSAVSAVFAAYFAIYLNDFPPTIAAVADHAAEAALGIPESDDDLKKRVRTEFAALLAGARAGRWTDETPVPPTVFGPMWPEGPPSGWPTEQFKDLSFVLKAVVQGGVPANEVTGELFELYRAMNEYHLAHGGSGLTVEQFRFLISAQVGAEV